MSIYVSLCHFNYNMPCCGYLWIHLFYNSLFFLDLDVCFLIQVRKLFSHYSSKFIPFSVSSPFGIPIISMFVTLMFSQKSKNYFYYFLNLFSFLKIYLLIMLLQLSHFPPTLTPLHPAHPLPPTFPPIVHVHGSFL